MTVSTMIVVTAVIMVRERVWLTEALMTCSGVSLRMESDVWNRARKRRAANELIVGWYHSHPGLGAFFSHTDRRTQAAFFAQPYSVGWVLDPDDGSEAFFVGRDSLPLSGVLYCDGVGAGAAGTNGPDTWGVA